MIPQFAVNIRELGAAGDGQTLDTPAIQAAIDRCAPAGGTVYVPPGRYVVGAHFYAEQHDAAPRRGRGLAREF